MADKEEVDVLSSDDNLDEDAMPKAQRLSKLPSLLIFGTLISVAFFVFYGLSTMEDSSEQKKVDPFADNQQLTEDTRQKSDMDFLNGQKTGNLKFETLNKKDPNDKDSTQLVEGPVIHGKGSNDARLADMEKKYQELEMKYNQMLLNKGNQSAPQSKEEAENARTVLELKREIAGMKKKAFFGALQNPSKTDFKPESMLSKSNMTATASLSPVSKSTSTNSAEMTKIIQQRRREALSALNAVDNTGTAVGGFSSAPASGTSLSSSNDYYNTGYKNNNTGATEYSRGYNGETLASYNNLNKTDSWVNSGKLEAPVNDFIVRAGFVIPATMISGITSDTPGQIMAQVNQSVFDTATGHHLLIPQGSRLVGTYSAGAVFGQERIMIAWQRIIYPDNKALDLNTMPGADMGGYSGFTDGVDNHWWKLISSAFLMSGITAAVTVSTDKGNNNSSNNNSSTNDVLRSSMATQFGSVVAKVIQRNLNVAPTLTIRPGYNFNVMVTKDLIFNGPYKSFDYK
ncbi:MAG: TrbI/VirB10 family protein [Succinivibrio dextrinosolvens]|nr:TrbI/VirB10 family protein [Succinivibrio dextrinosolvens]